MQHQDGHITGLAPTTYEIVGALMGEGEGGEGGVMPMAMPSTALTVVVAAAALIIALVALAIMAAAVVVAAAALTVMMMVVVMMVTVAALVLFLVEVGHEGLVAELALVGLVGRIYRLVVIH